MPRPSLAKKLGLALGIPLALAVCAELGLRLARFEHPPVRYARIVLWNPDQDAALEGSDALHAMDAHALWAPRPGAPIWWSEHGETLGREGYRGPLREAAHDGEALRIVTLGDSSTFGLGVEYDETWSARLEQELVERGTATQVLDFGVVGYTVLQGVERYRTRARHFHPDVVVAAFGAVNEHWPAPGAADEEKLDRLHAEGTSWARFLHEARKELRLAHLLAWLRLRADGGMRARHEAWVRPREEQAAIEARAGEVDWEGRRRVDVETYSEGLDALRRAVEADGARLALIAMPRRPIGEAQHPVLLEYTRATRAFADEHGLALCDAHADFRPLLEELGPDALFLGSGSDADHWHPTPRGHAAIGACAADAVLRALGGIR